MGATYVLACLVLPACLLVHQFLPFAIIAAVAIGALVLAKPFLGLCIYSVFVFIRPQEFISVLENSPIPVERSVALLLLLSIALKFIRERFHHRFSGLDFGIIAFVVACFISILGSTWIEQSINVWMDLVRLLIIYWFVVLLIESKRQMKLYILLIIFSSVFHAFASVINYFQGDFIANVSMNIDRAYGIDKSFAGPNSLAATLVYTLPFIYYYYLAEKSRLIRLSLIGVTPVVVMCIILTGSRTGMVGAIFCVFLVILNSRYKLRNIAIGIVLLLLTWIGMSGQYRDRFSSTADLSVETSSGKSAKARVDGLTKGIQMIMARPLTGYGIGNYGTAAGTIYSEGDWHEAHSLPGQVLGEIGLLGTTAFIAWIYVLFRFLKRLPLMLSKSRDSFCYLTLVGLKIQLFCLLFLGLAGHNLYRYNWYIISALVVVILKFTISDSELSAKSQKKDRPQEVVPI